MLHPFISVRPSRLARPFDGAVSVVVHGTLIAAFVAASGAAATRPLEALPIAVEHLTFVQPTPRDEAPVATADEGKAEGASEPQEKTVETVAPDLSRLQFDPSPTVDIDKIVESAAPPVDFAAIASSGTDFGQSAVEKIATGAVKTLARAGAYGAFTEDAVERAVWPRRGNPVPDYPPMLLRAGVEDRFFVRFVVDSTGKVDDQSIQIPGTVHKLFNSAVRTALRGSRFFPAELGGHRVRQLVLQEFKFVMAR